MASLRSFAADRWRGEAPLETVFWRDMIIVGTLINIFAAALSMALFAAGAPGGIALLVFFAPVPWNLFLFMAVWRAVERGAGEGGVGLPGRGSRLAGGGYPAVGPPTGGLQKKFSAKGNLSPSALFGWVTKSLLSRRGA